MTYKEIKKHLESLGYKEQIIYKNNEDNQEIEIFNFYNNKTKKGLNLEIEEY